MRVSSYCKEAKSRLNSENIKGHQPVGKRAGYWCGLVWAFVMFALVVSSKFESAVGAAPGVPIEEQEPDTNSNSILTWSTAMVPTNVIYPTNTWDAADMNESDAFAEPLGQIRPFAPDTYNASGMQSMPNAPSMPNMAAAPNMPSIPDAPGIPFAPNSPNMQSMPNAPSMPSIPSAPPVPYK
jgi:hypothetical protein